MTYTRVWDETSPAEDDAVANGARDIRRFKQDFRERYPVTNVEVSNTPYAPSLATFLTLKTIVFDTATLGADGVINLNTNGISAVGLQGHRFTVKNETGGGGWIVTITPNGAEKIDDASAYYISGDDESVTFESDNVGWKRVVVPQIPVGSITMYAGSSAPDGWLICDGTAYDGTTNPKYAKLHGAIGNTFGGSTIADFEVPDLRSRVPVGVGTGVSLEAVASDDWNNNGGDLEVTVTSNLHKWLTGMKVQITTSGGDEPSTISLLTDYYIYRASATLIRFATSLANLDDGTYVAWGDEGSGTHTITIEGGFSARTLGEYGGEENQALQTEGMASHVHTPVTVADGVHSHLPKAETGGGGGTDTFDPTAISSDANTLASVAGTNTNYIGNSSTHTHSMSEDTMGNDTPHNNLPPFLGLNYIIKY